MAEVSLKFFAVYTVADLDALRAIETGSLAIVNNEIRFVDAINSYNLRRTQYHYVQNSTASQELLPYLVLPSTAGSSGHWEMTKDPFYETVSTTNNGAPTDPPPLPNMRWIVNVSGVAGTPDRRLIWKAKDPFPNSPVVADWIGDTQPVEISGVPPSTFNADWEKQIVKDKDSSDGRIYQAVNQTGKWALLSDKFLLGTAIPGDFTIDETNHKLSREVAAATVITLGSLEIDIETKIIRGSQTLSIDPAGLTLNGNSTITAITEPIITLFNHGTNWFYH